MDPNKDTTAWITLAFRNSRIANYLRVTDARAEDDARIGALQLCGISMSPGSILRPAETAGDVSESRASRAGSEIRRIAFLGKRTVAAYGLDVTPDPAEACAGISFFAIDRDYFEFTVCSELVRDACEHARKADKDFLVALLAPRNRELIGAFRRLGFRDPGHAGPERRGIRLELRIPYG